MQERTLRTLEFDKVREQLAALAQSGPGKKAAGQLQPVADGEEIRRRLAETDDAVSYILEWAPLPLGGTAEVGPLVRRAASGAVLEPAELNRIAAFLRVVTRLKKLLPEGERTAPSRLVFQRLAALRALASVKDHIEYAVASDEDLHDHASTALQSLRRQILRAQEQIKLQLDRLVRSAGDALQDALVTMRGDRYVVPVKAGARKSVPGLVHDTSASGQTLFVEPLAVVEQNNRIRELQFAEREEVLRILTQLSAEVGSEEAAFLDNQRLLSQLDLQMAKGRLALAQKAVRPQVGRKTLVFTAARHPLLAADRVVPIDLRLGGPYRTLVITGPNTGGKTVSLKTCGLLTLMAQSGLFVPAAPGAELPLFSEVLADIGDEQSIEQSLSTFSSHMTNIVEIEKQADRDSLVLLDELGAGTDPSEGAALAMAILDALRRRGCLTIATTHYRELKSYALNTEGVENASCEFDLKTLRPTYRLMLGVPGVSQAFAISERLGLKKAIIAEARNLISDEGARFEEMVNAIKESHLEARRMEEEVAQLERSTRAQRDQLAKEEQKAARERSRLLAQAQADAARLYEEARQDVEETLARLAGEKDPLSHALASELRGRLASGRKKLGREPEPSASSDEVAVGGYYEVPKLGLSGEVREIDNRGLATLVSGAMTVRVGREDLRPAQRPKPKKGRRAAAQTPSRAATLTSELLLLGKTVEEALALVDQYLDDAVLAGLETARLVHGKGTGALRSAIGERLRRDPRVAAQRPGGDGEGGDGVTVVTLKH